MLRCFLLNVLPLRHFQALWLPVFVSEEAALRLFPPTPSSYCSGLLEWGHHTENKTTHSVLFNYYTAECKSLTVVKKKKHQHWKQRLTNETLQFVTRRYSCKEDNFGTRRGPRRIPDAKSHTLLTCGQPTALSVGCWTVTREYVWIRSHGYSLWVEWLL